MPAPLSLDLRATVQELLECGMTHEAIADDLSIPRSSVTTLKGILKNTVISTLFDHQVILLH